MRFCDSQDWAAIEARSGLTRAAIEAAAAVYARSRATIGVYGMGLTQHRRGTETVRMLANLLLLRGNIGKPGAGICPVRGHSNVQGQRTVGISEKPELVPLDRLKELYGFEPPREKGLNTVEACHGILDGSVRAFIGLGGNFLRAVPDTERMEPAWQKQRLTVQISTKLNRSHLVNGAVAYILPCLGRIEIDRQASGPQAVSMEDSTSCFHGSRGVADPVSAHVRSEPWIVAGIAKATLEPNPRVDWDAWVGDYARVREAIEATYPDVFQGLNGRMFTPGGLKKPLPARERTWKTDTGKANFFRAAGARGRSRSAGTKRRRPRPDDATLERPVQHHGLRLPRPFPRGEGHPGHPVHEPRRHHPARAERRGERRRGHRGGPTKSRVRSRGCASSPTTFRRVTAPATIRN